jgi:hypothetical protein
LTESITTDEKNPGWGGSRARAGRKKRAEIPEEDPYLVLAHAKAKHESMKAEIAELDLKKRSGELLERVAVETAAARMHSAMAQYLRGLPDDLERKCGLTPETVAALELAIDSATVELAERIKHALQPV